MGADNAEPGSDVAPISRIETIESAIIVPDFPIGPAAAEAAKVQKRETDMAVQAAQNDRAADNRQKRTLKAKFSIEVSALVFVWMLLTTLS